MTHRLWIFPAILCLLLSLTFYEQFLFLGFVLSILWMLRMVLLKQRPIFIVSVVIGLLFLVSLHFHQATRVTKLEGNETNFIVYPKMTSIKVDGDQVRFDGLIQNENVKESMVVSYTLASEKEKERWLQNPPIRHLWIKGELEVPAEASNFNQFNYRQYLKRQDIYWELEAEEIQVLDHPGLKKPIGALTERIRHRVFQYLDTIFQPKIANYLKILFFADKRAFSEDVLQNYRSLGVVHLFSISGFHISYLVGFVRQLLLRLGITHERTDLILMFILPLYGTLAGFGVSVFRAVFQNLFQLANSFRKQPLDTLDAWALTMILALFINPALIYHISFQLSYLLSGIYILMGKQKWTKSLHPLSYSLLFSLMSGLASLPILTYHFYEISWVTTLANLFFIPFFSNFLFPIFLFLLFSSLIFSGSTLFAFFEQVVSALIRFVEQLLDLLTATFDFSFVTGRLPVGILLLLILGVFLVLKKLEKKQQLHIPAMLLIGFTLFYHQLSPIGYVVMLDIGQGDSILIKEPWTQKVSLIDTGGRMEWGEQEKWRERENPFSIGRDIITPALKSFGISTIDRLYLTHADADHSGEVEALSTALEIKEIAATRKTFQDESIDAQIRQLRNTEFIVVTPPTVLSLPVENTLAIHPTSDTFYKDNNNQSLVIYVTLGDDQWLFTGDIEKEAEDHLVKEYPGLRADYLKISHHGSQTSSTEAFIQQLQPKTALISVGENNSFGHPHKDVIQRLEKQGTTIYSTDVNGAIMYRYLKFPFTDRWLTDTKTVHTN